MMSDIVRQARSYLRANAAETGADVLIEEMAKEIERLCATLEMIADIAEGGGTVNSLPNIARIARAALKP